MKFEFVPQFLPHRHGIEITQFIKLLNLSKTESSEPPHFDELYHFDHFL